MVNIFDIINKKTEASTSVPVKDNKVDLDVKGTLTEKTSIPVENKSDVGVQEPLTEKTGIPMEEKKCDVDVQGQLTEKTSLPVEENTIKDDTRTVEGDAGSTKRLNDRIMITLVQGHPVAIISGTNAENVGHQDQKDLTLIKARDVSFIFI